MARVKAQLWIRYRAQFQEIERYGTELTIQLTTLFNLDWEASSHIPECLKLFSVATSLIHTHQTRQHHKKHIQKMEDQCV